MGHTNSNTATALKIFLYIHMFSYLHIELIDDGRSGHISYKHCKSMWNFENLNIPVQDDISLVSLLRIGFHFFFIGLNTCMSLMDSNTTFDNYKVLS